MSRSPILRWLRKAASTTIPAVPTVSRRSGADRGRRRLIAGSGGAALALTTPLRTSAAARRGAPRIAIIGAGLAGLAAAHALRRAGHDPEVFEASERLGGRCFSERAAFAEGQIAERGGEFLDTAHTEILALAKALGLAVDDVLADQPEGSEGWALLDGARYTGDAATRDFQAVFPIVQKQARALGDHYGYADSNATARTLDAMSVSDWIAQHVPGGTGSLFGRLVANAFEEEYAIEAARLSAISLVVALSASPRDSFQPYAGSDQRFHIRGGNDALVARLAASLLRPVEPGMPLVALARRHDGRYDVTLRRGSGTLTDRFDRVVLALPFSNLRDVDLSRAGFRPRKLRAIRELPMGASTKLQLQFHERLWRAARNNGEVRLDGSFHGTWEVSRAQAGRAGILNFWSGGDRAVAAGKDTPEAQAARALADLEAALPGITRAWNGRVIRNTWDAGSGPRGSYAYYPPGYMTTLLGIEGEPEGACHFAGEHTSLEWQGYLNGAVESGQRAAREVLRAVGRR
jgi:monoamine oxidase